MRGDQTFGSFRLLILSTAFTTLFLAHALRAAELEPSGLPTLADMVSEASRDVAQPGGSSLGLTPLETVGAKGAVPVESGLRQPEGLADGRGEAAPAGGSTPLAQVSFDKHLARIVTRIQQGLEVSEANQPSEAAVGGGGVPAPLPDLAAEETSVPGELVFRLHERSRADSGSKAMAAAVGEAAADEAVHRFTLVMPVPQPDSPRVDPKASGTPNDSPDHEKAPSQESGPARYQVTGLTLADMAMKAMPAPPKQASRRPALPGVPLARVALPSRGASWARPRSSALVLPAPRTEPLAGIRFPDPRGFAGGSGRRIYQYPASASLARFLDGIERLPVRARGGGRAMPLNLEQVAQQAGSGRPAARWSRRLNPGFSFSFSGEAFAHNRLATEFNEGRTVGGRRQAVMDQLRGVFEPLR